MLGRPGWRGFKLWGSELKSPQDLSDAEPTYTHMSLTKLFRAKKVKHVVSQNCDGLHIRSGFPRSSLSELHGNMYIEMCYNCAPSREYVRLFDVTERTSVRRHATSRRCRACGSNLSDTIVHFGEKGKIMSPYRWKEAVRAAKKADLILCLGSSLKVLKKYTCLWCMDKKPHLRPKLAIVNLQWTPKDDVATLKINGRCDNVMRMVMKHLDYDVPEYQRDFDPIFRICSPLRANELKTTSKKILLPPAHLSKPPRQSKKSKNKEKLIVKETNEQKEFGHEQKSSEKMHTNSQVLQDEHLSDNLGQVNIEANPNPSHSSQSKSETFTFPVLKSDAQYPSRNEIICSSVQPFSSTMSLLSTADLSVKKNCKPNIDIVTSAYQVKPEYSVLHETVAFSSTNNHLLNVSSSFNPTTFSDVNSHLVTQEVAMPLPLGSLTTNSSAYPCHVDTENVMSQQDILNSSPVIQRSPTLVVVNLDMPTVSTPFMSAPSQDFTPSFSRPFLDDFGDNFKNSTSLSCDSSSKLGKSENETNPIPILLTCVGDMGQTFTIPVSTLSQTVDLTKSTPKSLSDTQSSYLEKNVTLDHCYFNDKGKESKTSMCKNDKTYTTSALGHSAIDVPFSKKCDSSKLIPEGASNVRRLSNSHYQFERTSSNIQPNHLFHPSSQLPVHNEMCESNYKFNECATSSDNTNNFGAQTVSTVTNNAPMCVLNMDEMETIYTLPAEHLHMVASHTKASDMEDITLELQLPVGCEILTMDMLNTDSASWDLQGSVDNQVISQKRTDLFSETSWQPLNLGNILQNMAPSEPLVNSILSSSLEPVVCNLAVDDPQRDAWEKKSAIKASKSSQVLSISLDGGSCLLPNIADQLQYQELSKVSDTAKWNPPSQIDGSDILHPGVKKTTPAPFEERVPLSPRSSELYPSRVATTSCFASTIGSDLGSVIDKPLNFLHGSRKNLFGNKTSKEKKHHKVKKNSQKKNSAKGILNYVAVEGKQMGLENVCKRLNKSKCAPASTPGWFGKGLGFKKKRK
ncbi:NAD-dependent deacetylase sirtuin-7 [Plakobranchus ocellatus]|uniref:Regulatory protein SIR2 homolog 7 n=1 Tax=Plakobranchus ocellatus TaxID=259542 RepID=A0AAV3Y7Q9_9GAST|nr:NAD-dependent deacetylase sirtuin-7 [Plakobranchus ocellatus]